MKIKGARSAKSSSTRQIRGSSVSNTSKEMQPGSSLVRRRCSGRWRRTSSTSCLDKHRRKPLSLTAPALFFMHGIPIPLRSSQRFQWRYRRNTRLFAKHCAGTRAQNRCICVFVEQYTKIVQHYGHDCSVLLAFSIKQGRGRIRFHAHCRIGIRRFASGGCHGFDRYGCGGTAAINAGHRLSRGSL